jgi:hypothetical protein
MGEQHEYVNHDFIACALNLEIFEENVNAEHLEGFINDILLVGCLEALVGWTFQFRPEWNEGHPASCPTLPVVTLRVECLNPYIVTIFSLVINNINPLIS